MIYKDMAKSNVMFVCLGNICRSPMAEAIFTDLVHKRGLDSEITARSSGTSGWHIGEPPDSRTIETAAKHQVKINHLGRKFTQADFENFNYIVAMDQENLQDIKELMKQAGKKHDGIFLMRKFDNSGSYADVPDPYYGGMDDFQSVYDILLESCSNFLDSIATGKKHR